jgi:hypothetical protein
MSVKTAPLDFYSLLAQHQVSPDQLLALAKEYGVVKRKARKINIHEFFALICLESVKDSPSFNDLAARFDTVYHISASRQAFWKKVKDNCVNLFKAVLARLIMAKLQNNEIFHEGKAKLSLKYKRLLIQDSTIVRLPTRLYDFFSGVSYKSGSVCNARIQCTYDLISGDFIDLTITAYSKNDITMAPDLDIQAGDLVLRDRGYYSKAEFKRHRDNGADCIYRHRLKNVYLDPLTKEPIDLLSKLEGKQSLEMDVCLNNKEMTKVRIIAKAVDQETADNRRRKAKIDTRGHNPTQALLKLMDWTIYLTTIDSSLANAELIEQLYRVRWRIELLFKAWKSHMHFAKLHNVSQNQFYVQMLARLITIVIFTKKLFTPLALKMRELHQRELSMTKFLKYITKNPEELKVIIIAIAKKAKDLSKILDKLKMYCVYDKRKKITLRDLEVKLFLS